MINAERLVGMRVRRGLSQRRLAFDVGVNYQVIRRLESGGDAGNLTLRHLARLCQALEVTPLELLAEEHPFDAPATAPDELTIAQARLLRRIQRGDDVRRDMSSVDRELILPSLIHRSLVATPPGRRPTLTSNASLDLRP